MRLVLSLIAAVLLLRAADAAVDITACGQSVPDFDTGTLQADLDCVAPGWCLGSPSTPCHTVSDCGLAPCVVGAVRLVRQATLQMNGHSITSSDLTMIGVFCVSEGPQNVSFAAMSRRQQALAAGFK